jgi:hypothetical protein
MIDSRIREPDAPSVQASPGLVQTLAMVAMLRLGIQAGFRSITHVIGQHRVLMVGREGFEPSTIGLKPENDDLSTCFL